MKSGAEAWTEWRALEARLGQPDVDLERARSLSPRVAELLHALHVLELGDRAAIAAREEATESPDVRAVLRLALAPAEAIDPTAVRKRLSSDGVENGAAARLDLLRAYAVALRNEPAKPPPALVKAARERPVTAAVSDIFAKSFNRADPLGELHGRSPHLRAVWSVARSAGGGLEGPVRQLAGRTTLDYEVDPHVLTPARWPKVPHLTRAKPRRDVASRPRGKSALERFLGAPRQQRFDRACELELEKLAEQGDRAGFDRAVGRLLVALHMIVTGPEPRAALSVIRALGDAVMRGRPTPEQRLLGEVLARLAVRLAWWSGAGRSLAIDTVLDALVGLTSDELAGVAGELLEAAEPGDTPEDVAEDLLRLHVVHPSCLSRRGLAVIMDAAPLLSRKACAEILRKVSPLHRALVTTAHAIGSENELGALEALRAAWAAARSLETASDRRSTRELLDRLTKETLEEVNPVGHASPVTQRVLRNAVQPLLNELVAGGAEVSVTVLADLAGIVASVGADANFEGCRAWMRSRLAASATGPDAVSAPEQLYVQRFVQDIDGATASFRSFGRWLREGSRAKTIPAALRWCTWTDEHTRDSDEVAVGWIEAVTKWLLQQPLDHLNEHAAALAMTAPSAALGLLDWAGEYAPDLLEEPAWKDMEHKLGLANQLAAGPGGLMDLLGEGPAGLDLEMLGRLLESFGRRRP